jgi:type IV secretion system protein TrbE
MFLKAEAKQKAQGLADLLDYYALIDDGILLLSTGSFLAAWEVRGPDMDALSVHHAWALTSHLAKQLSLGTGWTIQADQIRSEYQEYTPERPWPDPVSQLIDEERRAQFTARGDAANYQSSYFLCVSYQVPQGSGKKTQNWFFETDGASAGRMERELWHFRTRLGQIENALEMNLLRERHTSVRRLGLRPGGRALMHDDLCRYIRYCAKGEDFPFALPYQAIFLNQHLCPGDLITGAEPMLDEKRIRVIAVDSFPDASFAGILRAMNSIPFPFRFTQQAQCMDAEEAKGLHLANHNKWGMIKLSPLQAILKKNANAARIDPFAARLEGDALEASSDAQHGLAHFVRYSAKLILLEGDEDRLDQGTRLVRDVVQRAGFGTRVETYNATAAWVSSLPGHMHRERRTAIASTLNLVHMMPFSTPFQGVRANPSAYFPPNTPPLFYALTAGRSHFRAHLHVEDRGHTFIGGPQGSGKTTLQALAIAQFFGLSPDARVFAFDKKRTLYTLTKAMDGDYYDLTPGNNKLRFCPLQHLETDLDRSLAASYIGMLCSLNGLDVNAERRNHINDAIEMVEGRGYGRSLTDFATVAGGLDSAIKEALQFYTIGSVASGGILDGRHDNLTLSRFSVFEVDTLYQMDTKITSAVLFYIFNRIWRSLSVTAPTLVSVDELRASLDQPLAVKNFERFLVEGRKLNMALMLSIQEIGKVLESPLKTTINRECMTKIFLANPTAATGERAIYEEFGMDEIDIESIASAQPKADYYWTSPEGRRRIHLALGGVALSFLAASGDRDRDLVDALMERNPQGWTSDWLRQRGLSEWSDRLDRLQSEYQTKETKELAAHA